MRRAGYARDDPVNKIIALKDITCCNEGGQLGIRLFMGANDDPMQGRAPFLADDAAPSFSSVERRDLLIG